MKKALITGITGQDGSYLAEILLDKGYTVHGIIRRSSSFNTGRIDHLLSDPALTTERLFLHHGDITDSSSINRLLEKIQPDEIYNLAAQSHVKVSFEVPDYTAQVDALGTLRFLDAIRETGLREVKFYQASTSELYGKVQEIPQNEKTPFYPRSPYAVAKMYGFWIIINYREAYNIKAYNGILFNHESPRRGETFVTRKITRAAARILTGLQETLSLGNIDAKRDWGYAAEYCEGMWRILQHPVADDFVLATGETHTVREFIEKTFGFFGIQIDWKGEKENEKGLIGHIDKNLLDSRFCASDNIFGFNENKKLVTGETIVEINPTYYRPTEVELLIGDASKAKKLLGWEASTLFNDLVTMMAESDFQKVLKRGY